MYHLPLRFSKLSLISADPCSKSSLQTRSDSVEREPKSTYYAPENVVLRHSTVVYNSDKSALCPAVCRK